MKKFLLLSLPILILLTVPAHAADKADKAKKAASGKAVEATATDSSTGCEDVLASLKLRGLSVNEVQAAAEVNSLNDVMKLAKNHPLMVMSSDQKVWAAIKQAGSRQVLDPHYRADIVTLWNIFSAGTKETEDRRIVGQLGAIQTFVDWIRGRAEGRTDAGMLIFVGPGGTGKTYFANIITSALSNLGRENPDFYQYSYMWTDKLKEIPELSDLVSSNNRVTLAPTGRSPLTLFPVEIQKKIYMEARQKGQEMLGFNPTPKSGPHVQTEPILNAIIQHEAQKRNPENVDTAIAEIMGNEKLYNELLSPYVKIVRKYSSGNMVSPIVRYPGDKLPDLESMFAGKDLERHMTYKSGNPFSYNYSGSVTKSDGGLLAADELLRWPEDILNMLLEVSENGIVQISGMPALKIDVAMIGATNDESVAKASENGAIKAFKDRSLMYPMRYALHPLEVAETTLIMMSKENNALFTMRKLNGAGEPEGKIEPFDYSKVFPLPEADGILKGPDGRYAVYVQAGGEEPMLIAPRTLMMLGMIAGATHMVKDEAKLANHRSELESLTVRNIYFSDLATRMKVLTGDLRAEEDSAIRKELSRWRNIGLEGSSGISNRDAQRWLSQALSDARNEGQHSLSPLSLHRAFIKLLDTGGFTESGAVSKADWNARADVIRAKLILPYIKEDVMTILSGSSGEAERLYDEIKGELLARNMNPGAEEWSRMGERITIKTSRLLQINKIYRERYQKELNPAAIANYHAQNQDSTRDPELLDVIKHFLLDKEFDVTVYGEVIAYFKGDSVNQHIRETGQAAEKAMIRLGYDRSSFIQALLYIDRMERMTRAVRQ